MNRLEAEFAGVALGDERLNARAILIASRIAAAPAASFPEQAASVAEREGLYRFLANDGVTLQKLLQPHVQQTHERMRGHKLVRIAHDTTDFAFSGDREGLGMVMGGGADKGFFAHTALAIGADELREPLGVVGIRSHVFAATSPRRGMSVSKRSQICHKKTRDEKLSSRWEKLAIDVSRALPAGVRAIHVMDQEADDYALLAALQKAKLSFVVRGAVDRVLWHHGPSVADALSTKPAKIFRSIRVGARSKKAETQSHPARAERKAKLSLRWGAVTIRRGGPLVQSDVKELRVFAVHVCEMTPPTGEPSIEWMLFTTEAVETLADATAIVDHYRARWIIEEYFKALKTGCAFEKRQLTTRDGLERALGLFAPAAWKLLTLRYLGRLTKHRPASRIFTDEQLVLLRMMLEKRAGSLPASPTIRDAMFGIAALGGHILNNGDPGWIVLGRGYRRFLEAEEVWSLARSCDQS